MPGSGSQAEVVACLADPATHGGRPVEHVQTHISHVFLVGDLVYKLKKAVRLSFLDFGTIEKRETACREELRLNRRLAPSVYLDVLAVVREGGRVRLGGVGAAEDWVVRMRRLPAERDLGALVAAGAIDADGVAAIGRHLAAFHAAVPAVAGGDPEALARAWQENLDETRPLVGRFLTAEAWDVLDDFGRTFVVRHDAVLRARPARGHVRDGHGDLRPDHVYVLATALPALADAPEVPAGIHVIDCVEFSPAFRAIDVAADLAFLAMGLARTGRHDLARALVGGYAEAAGDPLVAALVPYYACHRAIVRGKVDGLTADDPAIPVDERERVIGRGRDAFALAGRYAWGTGDPVLLACAGLSGTGKSALATAVAGVTGWAVVGTDVLRRRGGEVRYDAAARAKVYADLRRAIDEGLGARESRIADATFLARAERDRLAAAARAWGARLLFVECVADEPVVRRRLDARDAGSVSDARWPVYVRQRDAREPFGADEPVIRVDTSGTVEEALRAALPRLWAWRQGRNPG